MKKNNPKISLVTPVYNVEKFIKNMIISVNNQTFKDFEFLLINDGSTDNSIGIATKELEKTKLNYRIINKENGGQSTARNRGINEAKGEWIAIIDSDDTIQKDYLKNMYEMTKKGCDVVICDLNKVTEQNCYEECNDDLISESKKGKEFFIDFIMHDIEIGPYSLLINKEKLSAINLLYDEQSRYSEEFIFITHLLYNSKKVVHLKQRLYNYCLRGGSVSTSASIDKIVNGYNEIIKNNKVFEDSNCKFCKIYSNFAIPRWILATGRFASKNLSYKNYKKLMNKFDYKNNLKKLKKFPKKTIRICALMMRINLPITYFLFRNMGGK